MVKGWGAEECRTAIAIAIRTGDRRMIMKAAATRSIAYFTANCQLGVGGLYRDERQPAEVLDGHLLHRLEEPWDERNRDAEILAPASDPQEDVMGCGRERDHGMLDGVFSTTCSRSQPRAENGDGQGAVSVRRGSLSR